MALPSRRLKKHWVRHGYCSSEEKADDVAKILVRLKEEGRLEEVRHLFRATCFWTRRSLVAPSVLKLQEDMTAKDGQEDNAFWTAWAQVVQFMEKEQVPLSMVEAYRGVAELDRILPIDQLDRDDILTEEQRVETWMNPAGAGWHESQQNPVFKTYVAALVKAIWNLSASKDAPNSEVFYV
ncbi:hypothetical protein KFL_001880160 [Klebsormidium nitens]|uniref:Uncharacterized protein n=1 Tax=Klebsormidium nitens TaxID=105231 RepID=A0A1Y1I389_KLENI|nr:hypothetical protein KFL_001880160 [Klebsormidium nitens]|eukprot:GAQ84422.1 hypothetical protein KFL_001880160 [Klebsormidium nitens]